MNKIRAVIVGIFILLSVGSTLTATATTCNQNTTICGLEQIVSLPTTLSTISSPEITTPEWMKAAAPAVRSVTYNVETRGVILSDIAEFKRQANETLNDARGWPRMGVRFDETVVPGDFSLVLARPEMIAAVPGCGAEYSCRSGRYVIINEDRWQGATPSWNNAGGSSRDYRHMVINHETGHWLGHGHANCSAAGQPAQVMQQQSIDLQGCAFNPWPTASELWSTTLGITL
jgi:hypothetical protein